MNPSVWLPCSVQNFRMIHRPRKKQWANEILRDFDFLWISVGYLYCHGFQPTVQFFRRCKHRCVVCHVSFYMSPWHGYVFRITGPVWRESIGHHCKFIYPYSSGLLHWPGAIMIENRNWLLLVVLLIQSMLIDHSNQKQNIRTCVMRYVTHFLRFSDMQPI